MTTARPLDVNLMGQRGSGKGTQAIYLVQEYGLAHFSPGQALRAEIKAGSPLGKRVKKIVEAGELVPSDAIAELLERFVSALKKGQGMVTDALISNGAQKDMLDRVMKKLARTPVHINIAISRKEAFERLSKRRVCEGCGDMPVLTKLDEAECKKCGGRIAMRKDDKPEVIKKRLDIYDRDTAPIVDLYRQEGVLEEVDGEQTPEEVHTQITEVLKKHGFVPEQHVEGAG